MTGRGPALFAAFLLLVGCSGPAGPTVQLTVYGAASLQRPLAEIKAGFEAANPGTTLAIATDSSATLRTQIEQGAPADVFLSADTGNPKTLVDAGLADGAAVPFAGNILTIIVPSANPAGIQAAADLARDGVRIVAAGDEVPISAYAAQVVANLAEQPGFPEGFADAYAANVVSREGSVSAIVARIGLGEADAGIVYASDARSAPDVMSIYIPSQANVTATYAGVVVKASNHPNQARAFLEWVAGAEGFAILERFGFEPPG
jgi:molybdate transport system substrate-binding protein